MPTFIYHMTWLYFVMVYVCPCYPVALAIQGFYNSVHYKKKKIVSSNIRNLIRCNVYGYDRDLYNTSVTCALNLNFN